MTSNDLIILEAINGLEGKIATLQQEMNQKFEIVQTEIQEMKQEIRVNSVKIEAVQNSVNWGFAGATIIITAIIAIVGLIATLAPTIREYFAGIRKDSPTLEEVKNLIDTAINKALVRN